MKRRNFIRNSGLAAVAATSIPLQTFSFQDEKRYFHQGRTPGYKDFRIIDEGLKVVSIESFTKGAFSLVKVTTDNGKSGWVKFQLTMPIFQQWCLHSLHRQSESELLILLSESCGADP